MVNNDNEEQQWLKMMIAIKDKMKRSLKQIVKICGHFNEMDFTTLKAFKTQDQMQVLVSTNNPRMKISDSN